MRGSLALLSTLFVGALAAPIQPTDPALLLKNAQVGSGPYRVPGREKHDGIDNGNRKREDEKIIDTSRKHLSYIYDKWERDEPVEPKPLGPEDKKKHEAGDDESRVPHAKEDMDTEQSKGKVTKAKKTDYEKAEAQEIGAKKLDSKKNDGDEVKNEQKPNEKTKDQARPNPAGKGTKAEKKPEGKKDVQKAKKVKSIVIIEISSKHKRLERPDDVATLREEEQKIKDIKIKKHQTKLKNLNIKGNKSNKKHASHEQLKEEMKPFNPKFMGHKTNAKETKPQEDQAKEKQSKEAKVDEHSPEQDDGEGFVKFVEAMESAA
ncbi:hypothetical protein EDB80DRAFT_876224 [Ilyonectria destructans]|nr:hypothetical protein EDB80DRAFT_876224 [Ilyonectria destructans]